MTFDLSSLDTLTASQSGVAMPLLHPRTGLPIADDNGKPYTVTLRGSLSDEYRAKLRDIQRVRSDRAARGIQTDQEMIDTEDTELLLAVTVGWNIGQLDGKDFPYSPDNARLLWSDKRFNWLRGRAIRFMVEEGNFLPPSPLA